MHDTTYDIDPESDNIEKITIREASEILGVTRRTVERYIQAGKLKKYEHDLRMCVARSEVAKIKNGNGSTDTTTPDVVSDVVPVESLPALNDILAQIGAVLQMQAQFLAENKAHLEELRRKNVELEREIGRLETLKTGDEEKTKAILEARQRLAELERENGQLEGELRAVKERKRWWEGFFG